MENKKFKLTKNNLNIIQLIQHIVYINKSVYIQMRGEKFNNDDSLRNNFELICDNYIRLNNPQSYIWSSELSNEINKYILMGNIIAPEKHILIINLERDYNNCLKIGLQFSGRLIEPVPINIFNVQFEVGD